MKVTVLGSGTSTGVPVIGCECAVCLSDDPRNQRLRTSLALEIGRAVLIVDTSPDFRQQCLRHRIPRVDGVLFTHAHADHIFGLDDIRIFNQRQKKSIPCFGSTETLSALRRVFAYSFEDGQQGGGKPKLRLVEVREPFEFLGATVEPIPLEHGSMEVYGYRIGSFAYLTDCNVIPEASYAKLRGVDTLILDALRYRPHATHFSVAEALEVVKRIGPQRTWLTHLSHGIDYRHREIELPPGVDFAYDGLGFEV